MPGLELGARIRAGACLPAMLKSGNVVIETPKHSSSMAQEVLGQERWVSRAVEAEK